MESLVLGVDAAWTPGAPSGVALVAARTGSRPRLLRIARSYAEFASDHQIGTDDWLSTPSIGRRVGLIEILEAVKRCSGYEPNVIALDIPLSPAGVRCRRAADNAISKVYGSRWASTHTPSADRPGRVSDGIFQELSKLGYRWASNRDDIPTRSPVRIFLETYPHPAIIEMLRLDRRLCYKVAKRGDYWPDLAPTRRWNNLTLALDRLHDALASRIVAFGHMVPKASFVLDSGPKSKGKTLKGIEDVLDAAVCALVGCLFLEGRVKLFGDKESAIWILHR